MSQKSIQVNWVYTRSNPPCVKLSNIKKKQKNEAVFLTVKTDVTWKMYLYYAKNLVFKILYIYFFI